MKSPMESLLQKPSLPERPMQITFDITYRCNAHCIHCYANASSQGIELDTETTLKIIDKIIEAKPLVLTISGGEALLRKDLGDILLYIYDSMGTAMPQTTMGTNGQIVPQRKELLETIRTINENIGVPAVNLYVSIHAADPTLHDHIMGVKGAFDKALKAVELIQASGVPLSIGVTPMQINFHQLDDILNLASSKNITVLNLSQFVPTGKGLRQYDLTQKQYGELLDWYLSKKEEYKGRIIITTHLHYLILYEKHLLDYKYFYGCAEGWFHLAIKANGDITLCPLMELTIDTALNERSILDIWHNNPVLEAVRERDQFPVCGKCQYKWKCGGCRCVAYAYTGSVTGEDIMCPLYSTKREQE